MEYLNIFVLIMTNRIKTTVSLLSHEFVFAQETKQNMNRIKMILPILSCDCALVSDMAPMI